MNNRSAKIPYNAKPDPTPEELEEQALIDVFRDLTEQGKNIMFGMLCRLSLEYKEHQLPPHNNNVLRLRR